MARDISSDISLDTFVILNAEENEDLFIIYIEGLIPPLFHIIITLARSNSNSRFS
ncbi:Uncharacterised protein [Escherichia coli]|uniref:Uncharacterized protein n=1 Tax=Escherichia coli TaxID=562 RepID=A0A485JML3_ECOLX|nr:Uncharacterised protein [Escherichia coli]